MSWCECCDPKFILHFTFQYEVGNFIFIKAPEIDMIGYEIIMK